jgi:uncharacterized protein with PIN domain
MERFIADAMLGRLARWMRLLGFDTQYYSDVDDRTVMRIAKEQNRTILTRDSDFRRQGVGPCVFVKSDHVGDQLRQVIRERALVLPERRRCTECNGEVNEVHERESVRDIVPEYVYHEHRHFSRCRECGRVYWDGSHIRNFSTVVKDLFERREDGE